MQILEQANRQAADLQWLAFLLTADRQVSVDIAVEAVAAQDYSRPFFSSWMLAWSRRIVIAKALATVRKELDASAIRIRSGHVTRRALPGANWTLGSTASKAELERALLAIDVFPRAALVLSIFERVPLTDAAVLLDADASLVRKAQAIALRELTSNLAASDGWCPASLVGSDRARCIGRRLKGGLRPGLAAPQDFSQLLTVAAPTRGATVQRARLELGA